jgi:GT2 family glycosyltransferase
VDWVTGCSILIPVQKLVEIGVLDEAYFLYGEELEWQLRARRLADARSYVVASPLVHHRVGATTGSTQSTLGTTFMARNQLKLLRTQSGGFWPFWLLHWARAYLLRPLKLRRPALVLAALRGLCNMRTSGADIVERYGRFTDPSPAAICHDLRT